MKYENIKIGNFIERPNRFIAHIEVDGNLEICHVKNTGRCKELLIPNSKVFVQEFDSDKRKTKYDLISVYKENKLVNIDSQAPNKVVAEFLPKLFDDIKYIKPEAKYKNSRFDFYVETISDKIFLEVKGVTLEDNGVVLFPDAPTERGIKHINELIDCKKNGYLAYIIFVIQMEDVKYLTPNNITHEAFGDALKRAKDKGVEILAFDCKVTKDSITAKDCVEVRI
ncbi:MAG TPA: DNA/RNA nuclease SfsA [Clostridiales bacterium]|nr:DNA/RNA nuclease SfsA [Clostridiales bacterium]